jgi:glycosyltransferase involved in cell wall biosynthesis
MTDRRLIVIGPLPPPFHGVTVSTSLVLENTLLNEGFAVEHLDTSDHREGSNVGTWDLHNIRLALLALARLSHRLRGAPGIVYIPLSQNAPGFLRDSLLIQAAAARKWTVAAHLRGSDFRSFYDQSSAPVRLWIRKSLLQVSSVGVMGASLQWVFEGLVPPDRIAVVPNGTPEPRITGVNRDGKTVLFLSNLRRRKGVVEALEAALLVHRQEPSARFLFVGAWEDVDLERQLRELAAPAGDRVEFLPTTTSIERDRLLASSSIALFPPVEPEGHPRVVLEAIAAGLPVVTTDRGAIAETVIDGEGGFVLPEPNPEHIAERVLTLLRAPELREWMGNNARATYLERFTQSHADQRLAEWLSNVSG